MQINARRKYTLPNFQTATSNISNTLTLVILYIKVPCGKCSFYWLLAAMPFSEECVKNGSR